LTFVACNDRIDALLLLQLEHLLSILLQTNVCNFCAKQFDIVFAVMPWCGNTLGQVREAVVKVWSVASVCQINLYEETETGCRLVGICQLLTWFFHGTPDDASSSSWLCREGTNHYGGRGLGISQVVLDVAFVSDIEYLFRAQFRSHIEIYIEYRECMEKQCLEPRGKLGSTAQDRTYHAAHHVGECTPARAGKRCYTWYKAAAARLALF
jgi:hypothetical protein